MERAPCGQVYTTFHGARVCRRNVSCQHHENLDDGSILREMGVMRRSMSRCLSILTSRAQRLLKS